jgi:hypothetical protein
MSLQKCCGLRFYTKTMQDKEKAAVGLNDNFVAYFGRRTCAGRKHVSLYIFAFACMSTHDSNQSSRVGLSKRTEPTPHRRPLFRRRSNQASKHTSVYYFYLRWNRKRPNVQSSGRPSRVDLKVR